MYEVFSFFSPLTLIHECELFSHFGVQGYHFQEKSLQHPVEQAGLSSNLPRDLEKLQHRDSTAVGASGYSHSRKREEEEGEKEDDFDGSVGKSNELTVGPLLLCQFLFGCC